MGRRLHWLVFTDDSRISADSPLAEIGAAIGDLVAQRESPKGEASPGSAALGDAQHDNDLVIAYYLRYQQTREANHLSEAAQVAERLPAAAPAEFLVNLSAIQYSRYLALKDDPDLDDSIKNAKSAVAAGQLVAARNLVSALVSRYLRDRDAGTLAEARDYADAALEIGDSHRVVDLSNLLDIRCLQLELGNDPDAYGDAVSLTAQTAAAMPRDPGHAAALLALAKTARLLFGERGDLEIAALVVTLMRECVAATDAADPDRPERLYQLAYDISEVHDRSGSRATLEETVAACRDALAACPQEDPDRARYLWLTEGYLVELGHLSWDVGLIREAAGMLRAALPLVRDDQQRWQRYARRLCDVLAALYERAGEPSVAEEFGARCAGLARKVPESDHELRAEIAAMQCSFRLITFEWTGDRESLFHANRTMRAALAQLPAGNEVRGETLTAFLGGLMREYELTGNAAALREAIAVGEAADAELPPGASERALLMINLVPALIRLYENTGEDAAGDRAIVVGRQAVAEADTSYQGLAWSNLQMALATVGLRTGDLATLREAVSAGHTSLETIPADHPLWVLALSNLGVTTRTVAAYTGDATLLRESVSMLRDAVASTPPDHPNRANSLSHLAGSLLMVAERTGDAGTGSEAVAVARAGLAASKPGQVLRWQAISFLSNALHIQYANTGNIDVARELLMLRRAAVAAADDPFARCALASGLCASLLLYFNRTGNLAALGEAISAGRDVAVAPVRHPVRSLGCFLLGEALLKWHEATGDATVLGEAAASYQAAAIASVSIVPQAVGAWRGLARVHAARGDTEAALTAMENAVAAMGSLAPRRLNQQDRRHRLSGVMGTGSHAAAVALTAGQPVRALELIEDARGRLLAEAMGSREEIDRLADRFPALAAEFTANENEYAYLESVVLGSPAEVTGGNQHGAARLAQAEELAERREKAEAERAELLDRIRAKPGFADFLLPHSVDWLRKHAGGLPVVTVTAYADRCDALILTADERRPVRHVRLAGVTAAEVDTQAARFRSAWRSVLGDDPGDTQQAAQRVMLSILAWLWDTVVSVILAELGHTAPPDLSADERWPRVWWCPAGSFAYLPLHAAGRHGEQAEVPAAALDLVASSYTATIRTLAFTGRPRGTADSGSGAVVIAAAEVPGLESLDLVPEEVAAIARLIPGATILEGPSATREAVQGALREHPIAHFACHGVSNAAEPQDSRLELTDSPLTIADVSGLRLDAELAYLSACETTDAPVKFADEAPHLTGTFQMAGYRQVIGTLWPVSDKVACDTALAVYGKLTRGGTRFPAVEDAALELHEATRGLRAQSPLAPALWGGFIHVGG